MSGTIDAKEMHIINEGRMEEYEDEEEYIVCARLILINNKKFIK